VASVFLLFLYHYFVYCGTGYIDDGVLETIKKSDQRHTTVYYFKQRINLIDYSL